MAKNKVITISREFGSGGRDIGEKVAKALNIPYYDKVLIDMIANDSGMSAGFIEENSEQITMTQAFNMATLGYYTISPVIDNVQVIGEDLFVTQSKIIKSIAEEGPCVIVGRCADSILEDRDDVLNVFIHADYDERAKRAIEKYGVEEKNVSGVIKKSDKARAKHYSFYCEKKWGKIDNYHMVLDSGKFGIDKCVKLICEAYKED